MLGWKFRVLGQGDGGADGLGAGDKWTGELDFSAAEVRMALDEAGALRSSLFPVEMSDAAVSAVFSP